jgi:hypothetical protein
MEIKHCIFNLGSRLELSSQLHAPAALHSGKKKAPTTYGTACLDKVNRREFLPQLGIKPGSSSL